MRRATAYHEAGHAVVLWHFGLPVSEVSIDPGADDDGDYLGYVKHPPPLMLDGVSARERRQAARQMILASFAAGGGAAGQPRCQP